MSSHSGFEAALDIHSKLFNHKPVVQTEVKNFIRYLSATEIPQIKLQIIIYREFEEKRGDREVDAVFSSLERVSELRDIGLPGLTEHLTGTAPTELLANLAVSESMFSRILEQEDSKEVEKTLAASREARQRDWEIFLQETQARCTRGDNSFREQEEAIRKKYQDLQVEK